MDEDRVSENAEILADFLWKHGYRKVDG
jgi:hypothetical protein